MYDTQQSYIAFYNFIFCHFQNFSFSFFLERGELKLVLCIQAIFQGSQHSIVFYQGMSLFEGSSMVPFREAVLWFWMDNLVSHFTIRLSFRVSSDLCHMDIEWRSGTANCTAGCSKTQRGAAKPACLDPMVVLVCNDTRVYRHTAQERNKVRSQKS